MYNEYQQNVYFLCGKWINNTKKTQRYLIKNKIQKLQTIIINREN